MFDGTLMNEVLEHVADEKQALSEVFRVLKPGGVFVLISPNRWFPIDGHFIKIGSWTFGPAPLIPWLPKRLTRSITVARNYWPAIRAVDHGGRGQAGCRGRVVSERQR